MGSSMSDPVTFKEKNRQKHFQAYQRKFPNGDSIPQKIKLKQVKSQGKILNRETIDCKKQMKREQRNFRSDMKFDHFENQKLQNQEVQNKKVMKQKIIVSYVQNPIENQQKLKQSQQRQTKNKSEQSNRKSGSNFQSNRSTYKKITLNNQTYEIDIEKMKSRRLKNKERYTNSILSTIRTPTVAISQNQSPQQLNEKSFVQPISSLELQSNLNSIKTNLNSLKAKKLHQNLQQKYSDSLYDSDKLKESSNFSHQQHKEPKNSKTFYNQPKKQPIKSFYSEGKP